MLAALAERMWLTGSRTRGSTRTPPPQLPSSARPPGAGWSVGDLAVWLRRLGCRRPAPGEVAEPFRLALDGRHSTRPRPGGTRPAAPFDEAMAWADRRTRPSGSRAVERLDLLGAIATADRLRRVLRQEGVTELPVRPRATTRANPAGLTNRQLDVAKLVARGFTNAEIAPAVVHLPQDRRPPRLRRADEARPAQPPGRRRAGARPGAGLSRPATDLGAQRPDTRPHHL